MCNCGNKRNEFTANNSYGSYDNADDVLRKIPDDVWFEYTGKTALSAQGSFTGKTYRFTENGNRQLTDYRDASGMMGIPVLKKVKVHAV
jgi:hypothetical protein